MTMQKFIEEVGANNPALQWLRPGRWEWAIWRLRERIERCRNEASKKAALNVLDPFALASIAAVERYDLPRLLGAIPVAQTARCISQAVGAFHEDLIRSARGWEKGTGCDSKTISGSPFPAIAEMKNKHNTVKKTDRLRAIGVLDEQRKTFPPGTKAYFVEMIPKRPERYCHPVEGYPKVDVCDGATFYTMVSGRQDAMREVLSAMMPCIEVDSEVADYLRALKTLPE